MSKNKETKEEISMKRKGLKLLASTLVFIMMFSYISIVQEVFATNTQNVSTGNANVEFDVYFSDDTGRRTIGEENYLYAKVNVNNSGYLKNGTITFENPNFDLAGEIESEYVSKFENGVIYLKQINAPKEVIIAIPIKAKEGEKVGKDDFNSQFNVQFQGKYVTGNGTEKTVSATASIGLIWDANRSVKRELEPVKVIPYTDAQNKKHIAIEFKAVAKLEGNTLPLSKEKIEISLPLIDSKVAEKVVVSANTTKQINGEEIPTSFTSDNYTFDSTENKLTIEVENTPDANGKISWKKDANDEYIVTAVYDAQNINLATAPVQIKYTSKVTLTTANGTSAWIGNEEGTQTTRTITGEEGSKLVEFDVKTNVETLSKGQIYANYNSENKADTVVEEKIYANIAYADLVDKIVINQETDKFVKENGTKVNGFNSVQINSIKINKNNFEKILGEEGKINIYFEDRLIATINKDCSVDNNNNYVANVSDSNAFKVKIETSKPVSEGNLELDVQSSIYGNKDFSIGEMNEFIALEQSLNLTSENSIGLTNQATDITKTINLTEPQTTAELTIDREELSTVVPNTDVKLTAVLRTDSLDYMLYKDPTLNITLPNYITDINVKNIEVLFETEGTKLDLANSNVVNNDNGTKTIQLELNGTQTEYTLGAVSKGVNVVITADITVNTLAPNKQETIVMNYTNNYMGEEEKETTATINLIAPVGVVTVSMLENYAENAATIAGISEDSLVGKLELGADSREARFNMYVLNNYTNTIDNVVVLGRTLFEGNKAIEGGADLGSNVNMPLSSYINVTGVDASKVKVYYSENGLATKDLSLASNGWTLDVQDLSKVKSYLIVVEDVIFNVGEGINFSYNVNIPANLDFNKTAYEDFVVYYSNNLPSGTIQDKELSTKLGMSTGRGAKLEATLSTDTDENVELIKGQTAKYTLKVKNIGTDTAVNVVATLNLPAGLSSSDNKVTLGNIAAGAEVTREITVVAGNTTNNTDKVETKATVKTDSLKDAVETNSVYSTIAKTYYGAGGNISHDAPSVVKENDTFDYIMRVISTDYDGVRENTVLEVTIPNEIDFEGLKVENQKMAEDVDITNSITYNYNKNTRKLTINLGNVDGKDFKKITLSLKVGSLPDGVYEKEITIPAKVTGKDVREQEFTSDPIAIGKVGFRISQTSTITENTEISSFEDFKYVFEIENLSGLKLYDVELKDILPSCIGFSDMKITYDSGITDFVYDQYDSENPTASLNFNGRETAVVEVNVFAKDLSEAKTITNKATLSYNGEVVATSNGVSHKILEFVQPSGNGEVAENTKRISGQVWYEDTIDGMKDDSEKRVSNVEVLLFDNTSGSFVTDYAGSRLSAVTGEDGTYTFGQIPQGRYTVVFLYNTADYSATTYRMENVDDTKNSDAIDTKITIDGLSRVAAITEEIVVSKNNVYNIDLGLVKNPKFDLSLNKTVSKITVQDSEGSSTYNYENTKLAKADIVGKKVNDTTIVVEYKIEVKNEGAIAGYVKKIVDYMPASMKFSTELNKDWYTGTNGEIYNSSLSNTIIKPGETKEVTLILTKKLTEDTLGLINNTAEIYEAYNDLGIADYDSTVQNKVTSEDDISSADVLVTVKTGEWIVFTGLTITIIAIIGVGAYFIKKKVLK